MHDRLFSVPRLTVRGWSFLVASAVLFVAAVVLAHREISFAAAFALALPVLGLVLVSVRRLPLTVSRNFAPEVGSAGGSVEVRIDVRHWGSVPTPSGFWYDEADRPLVWAHESVLPALQPYRSTVTDRPAPHRIAYSLPTPARGVHLAGPLVVQLIDPFGLAYRRIRIGGADALTVTPATVALGRGVLKLAAGDGRAQQSRRLGGGGEQDVIARKYQTGDSIRRVHWPATARHGEMMVRQDDQQNDQDAIVLIDTAEASFPRLTAGRPHGDEPVVIETFEWVVSMAASIGLHLLGEGFRVRLIESGLASHSDELTTAGTVSYALPGGDEQLLLHTARTVLSPVQNELELRRALSDATTELGELPPVFAVLGRLSEAALAQLLGVARLSSFAVAFVVVGGDDPTPPSWAVSVQHELESSGWIVRLVSVAERPDHVWESVGSDRAVL
jgi:uncharacterized protein (DUF58 family)